MGMTCIDATRDYSISPKNSSYEMPLYGKRGILDFVQDELILCL